MILITHDLGIVAQTCEQVAIIYGGEVVEYADTDKLFSTPQDQRTEDYITGRFG